MGFYHSYDPKMYLHRSNLLVASGEINRPCGWDYKEQVCNRKVILHDLFLDYS